MAGKCKCGEVTYLASGELKQMVNCHCKQCREMNGNAFSSYVVVAAENFSLTGGSSRLTGFAVTDRVTKHFCNACGTPIYNSNPVTYPGLAMLYLGTLEGAEQLSPGINIFCESRLSWVNTIASVKSINGGPRARA